MLLKDQNGSIGKPWFFQHLRFLLGSLYDPSVLGRSPLPGCLTVDVQLTTTSELREFLIKAIESLKPTENTPPGSKLSRAYEILHQRYIEQQTQRKVADNISLSTRQLQREDKMAVDILGETIWETYHLQDRVSSVPDNDPETSSGKPGNHENPINQQQDLDWLQTTTPAQATDISIEIKDIIATLRPVFKDSKINVIYRPEKNTTYEDLYIQAPILRQGLLNILSMCVSFVPQGEIRIVTSFQQNQVLIIIKAFGEIPGPVRVEPSEIESVDFAEKLIVLCNGSLLTYPGQLKDIPTEEMVAKFIAQITLPTTKPFTVLVVEDNADTLELYRRHLVNSRYRFIGASNAREGLSLAKELSPQVVILDVMMPEKDGWSFLGKLRVHPKTQNIPVIMSSILHQANLAQTLGAAEFLHKPVSRSDLLEALDRQIERLATKSE